MTLEQDILSLDRLSAYAARATDIPITDVEFHQLRDLVYEKCGINLTDAKKMMLRSRLQKRLYHLRLSTFREYYEYLFKADMPGDEMREMINCITTNKTDFFREPHHFDFIKDIFVPELIHEHAHSGLGENKLRVWHAGCSTGEEPYTMAMVLADAFGSNIDHWDIRLLASDIDTKVLDHASAGIYDLERFEQVPEHYRKKCFLKGSGAKSNSVKIKSHLQDVITFKQINLLETPWPINPSVKFDIIFCRNVVIYFDKATQRKLFKRYHALLKPRGYLIIGHSESLLGVSDEFDAVGHTIYRTR
jgi:chemotaxis protein methyltransferase CheR